MKFAVCGDSWFSSDPRFPGASFGEIIAEQNNWELISLARGGCSNFTIALQIDKSLEMGAEFILVGTTTIDRIELPIIDNSTKSHWEKLKAAFNWKDWGGVQPNVFDKSRGLSNVQYSPHPDLSSRHDFLVAPTIISESMNNLVLSDDCLFYNLTTEQETALKLYMLNLYDATTKRQVDSWIVSNACRKLVESKVPFLIFTSMLYGNEFYVDLEWLDPKHNITNDDFDMYDTKICPTRFHYSANNAGQKIANYIQTRIEKLL